MFKIFYYVVILVDLSSTRIFISEAIHFMQFFVVNAVLTTQHKHQKKVFSSYAIPYGVNQPNKNPTPHTPIIAAPINSETTVSFTIGFLRANSNQKSPQR